MCAWEVGVHPVLYVLPQRMSVRQLLLPNSVPMSAHDIHDDVLTAPALLYSLCVQHKLIELSPTEVDLLETALGEKGTTFALVRYSS